MLELKLIQQLIHLYWFLLPMALFLLPIIMSLFNENTDDPDSGLPVIYLLFWTASLFTVIGHYI